MFLISQVTVSEIFITLFISQITPRRYFMVFGDLMNYGQLGISSSDKNCLAKAEETCLLRNDLIIFFLSVEGRVAAAKAILNRGIEEEYLIIAVILSVIISLIVGFIMGYKIQSCRYRRERDSTFYDRNCSSLQRGRNRLSSGDNPYFHTDHLSLTPKQMNYVVNLKPGKTNTGVETKPVTKSNKVYL